MNLSEILNSVEAIQVIGNAEEKTIAKITIDSREVEKNSLFVAIKGFRTDGHKFVMNAVNSGASAIVLQDDSGSPDELFNKSDCVKILVKDSRAALADIAHIYYGKPSEHLVLIGITGTKGKTTSAFFVKNVLESAGKKTGLIGTISNYIGDEILESKLTTPEAHQINEMLKRMKDSGCEYCVMEVSSHALALKRVRNLDFNYTVFTNITSDHLDFHKTFEEYLDSKKILFDEAQPSAIVLCNADDKSWQRVIADSEGIIYLYGSSDVSDFKIENADYNLDGTSFSIKYHGIKTPITTSLIGKFTPYNAAVSYAIGLLEGIESEVLVNGISGTPQVLGRFEVISKNNKKVIIDYSHTADSLEQSLVSIKHIVGESRPIYTVFGCGGDRDKSKRPVMGEIAERYSSKIYITSDNPRSEDPFEIIDQIKTGLKFNKHKVIENREEAIKTAVQESENDAVVLIAGKGHETYQEINGVRNYFSDKEVAEKYLL